MSKPTRNLRFFTARLVGSLVLGISVALLIAIAAVSGPRRHTSRINSMVSNLRQLDGAVQQWAIDHHQTSAVLVTKDDIASYLPHWLNQVAGERYVLKTFPQSPEVELTREVEGRPQGTIIRFATNGGDLQFILPNPQGGVNGKQPPGTDADRTSAAAASRRSP